MIYLGDSIFIITEKEIKKLKNLYNNMNLLFFLNI